MTGRTLTHIDLNDYWQAFEDPLPHHCPEELPGPPAKRVPPKWFERWVREHSDAL